MILHYTTQFKKDYKKIKQQNKDLSKLRVVIEKLVDQQTLEPKYKDHQLTGRWKGHQHLQFIRQHVFVGHNCNQENTNNNSCFKGKKLMATAIKGETTTIKNNAAKVDLVSFRPDFI